MKRFQRAAALLLTLLLIGAGAAMPWAASWAQDAYLSGSEERAFDSVRLTLRQEGGLGDILRLMTSSHAQTDWTGETALTREEVRDTFLKVLEQMNQADLLPEGHLERLKAADDWEVAPQLVVDGSGERTAVIWLCWLIGGEKMTSYYGVLDDASGKLLEVTAGAPPVRSTEAVYRLMDRWYTFFQDYYGIEITNIEEDFYDSGWGFRMCFDPGDGLGPLNLGLSMFSTDYEIATFTFLP